MSEREGDFMDTTPPTPNPWTTSVVLNQILNNQMPMNEIFSQSTTRGHHGARRKMNISPFASFYGHPLIISPEFSPSARLLSPNMLPSHILKSPITINRPPKMVKDSGKSHEMRMISNNRLTNHQPMHVGLSLPPQEVGVKQEEVDEDRDRNHDNVDVNEDEDKDKDEEHIFSDVDDIEIGESWAPTKRRKYHHASNTIGAIRPSKQQRVVIQLECEKNNLDDGFRWRKYGQKIVQGNHNPRSYYKCTYDGCEVKKRVERGPNDVKLLVFTYDGKHEHDAPPPRTIHHASSF